MSEWIAPQMSELQVHPRCVRWEGKRVLNAETTTVEIRAPKDSKWSVAVDAGPGEIDAALDQ
jgi:hypothetical protein